MHLHRLLRLIPALVVVSIPAMCQDTYDLKKCSTASSVPWDQAQRDVVQKGPVEIPPLAKAAGIQGTVRVEICVSEAGAVVLTKPVNGHPILLGAALQSVKEWRFKPGRAGPIKTILEVTYSQGGTPAQIAEEEKVNDRYFEEEDKCREKYRSRQYDEALTLCLSAIDLVEKLPKARVNERRIAYQIVGHVYFSQRKFDDALRYYDKELQNAIETLHSYEAELAYAHHDVAMALHAAKRPAEAAPHYASAEQTMVQARDHIGLDELKPRYSATLKQIREHYLILLQQTGQTEAAADLQKRIQSDQE
jgi:TonB family protein